MMLRESGRLHLSHVCAAPTPRRLSRPLCLLYQLALTPGTHTGTRPSHSYSAYLRVMSHSSPAIRMNEHRHFPC
ncbi:hypothetical protein E2C01_045086 [Portunus trituberculatus]|uniref:Uncharacterized protein n=1 Tax=Portunus trituberculatus TaxID=210409 RepID=A0A5B7FXB7_PORTR|nr:hypothetical protein [Portunus trituberculatus]